MKRNMFVFGLMILALTLLMIGNASAWYGWGIYPSYGIYAYNYPYYGGYYPGYYPYYDYYYPGYYGYDDRMIDFSDYTRTSTYDFIGSYGNSYIYGFPSNPNGYQLGYGGYDYYGWRY